MLIKPPSLQATQTQVISTAVLTKPSACCQWRRPYPYPDSLSAIT